ncbi:MAG: hypothetical protein ACKVTZ_18740 [Bacteroidia bacterium]
MKKSIVFIIFFTCFFFYTYADRILEDLNLNSGEWVVIGVPLHNYKALPVQQEMGTFICKEMKFIQKIQKEWDFEFEGENKCDYHYTLKFYRNRELVRTLKLNLYCGSITDDGLSYNFDPRFFEAFKSVSKPVSWSRISFKDYDLAKRAVNVLNNANDIYWYEDVKPYQYEGFFAISMKNVPWETDLDSLKIEVKKDLIRKTGRSDFYLMQSFYTMDEDVLNVRYYVNCNESFSQTAQQYPNRVTLWRSHLQEGDSIRVVAIGVNEDKYRKLMGFDK